MWHNMWYKQQNNSQLIIFWGGAGFKSVSVVGAHLPLSFQHHTNQTTLLSLWCSIIYSWPILGIPGLADAVFLYNFFYFCGGGFDDWSRWSRWAFDENSFWFECGLSFDLNVLINRRFLMWYKYLIDLQTCFPTNLDLGNQKITNEDCTIRKISYYSSVFAIKRVEYCLLRSCSYAMFNAFTYYQWSQLNVNLIYLRYI